MASIKYYNDAATPEERAERARKAGVVSGEKRREYSRLNKLLKAALVLDVRDKSMAERLREMGLEPTNANAIIMASIGKAAAGDVEAARFVRDTVGEKPTEAYQLAVTDKPIKAMDLSRLTDEELSALADTADG